MRGGDKQLTGEGSRATGKKGREAGSIDTVLRNFTINGSREER